MYVIVADGKLSTKFFGPMKTYDVACEKLKALADLFAKKFSVRYDVSLNIEANKISRLFGGKGYNEAPSRIYISKLNDVNNDGIAENENLEE